MEQSQEEMLEQQRAQCIFCKIIKGEVPSQKVYEDDKVIAILDINPAVKGHVLLLPKEHYPILPLIPPDIFQHMFSVLKKLAKAVKDALVVNSVNIFIANGGAAGQMAPHFMLHIIPRESGDGLSVFDLKMEKMDKEKTKGIQSSISERLTAYLQQQAVAQEKITKEQLMKVIEQNPQLKQVLLENPDQLKGLIKTNPQLQALFKDFDVDEIAEELKTGGKVKEAEFKEEETEKEEPEEKEEEKEPEKEEKEEEKEEPEEKEEEKEDSGKESEDDQKADLDEISKVLGEYD